MQPRIFTVGVFVGGLAAGLLLARYAVMLVNLRSKAAAAPPQPAAIPSQQPQPEPLRESAEPQVMSGDVNSRYHLYPGSMYAGRAR